MHKIKILHGRWRLSLYQQDRQQQQHWQQIASEFAKSRICYRRKCAANTFSFTLAELTWTFVAFVESNAFVYVCGFDVCENTPTNHNITYVGTYARKKQQKQHIWFIVIFFYCLSSPSTATAHKWQSMIGVPEAASDGKNAKIAKIY